MPTPKPITRARILRAIRDYNAGRGYPGFCLKCGVRAEGVEPDARKYECEACGEPGVYGAEEVLLMTV